MKTAATPTTAKPKGRRRKAKLASNDGTALRHGGQEVGTLAGCDRPPPVP
jgi:hypothetical protein